MPEFASAPSAPVPLLQFNGLARTVGRQFALATVRIFSDRPPVGSLDAIVRIELRSGRGRCGRRGRSCHRTVYPEADVLRTVSVAMSRNRAQAMLW